jgi:hypothetical protein
MVMRSTILLKLGSLSMALALLSGCGSMVSAPPQKAPVGSFSEGSLINSTLVSGEPACQDRQRNVLPKNFPEQPGSFTFCADPANSYRVEIYAELPVQQDEPTDQICIFPAQYYPGNPTLGTQPTLAYKLDYQGLPLFQCLPIDESGMEAIFEKAAFDAAFVVRLKDRLGMSQCLAVGRPELCPAYAKGRFR